MAARPNPFTLKKGGTGGGPDKHHPARVYTEEEITALLENYYSVDPQHWALIPIGGHIRYKDTEKGFRYGGYVKVNPLDKVPDGEQHPKRSFWLQGQLWSSAQKPGVSWTVAYENVESVWLKADAATAMVMDSITSIAGQLNKKLGAIVEQLEEMDARLRALEKRK